ncbi:MAG: peptidase C14 caspase catalytic subunit p20 [Bacteroidetes bacterium]|nr:peptidase C14 caspase catalytic subunit p20 [Bacteroidota bacterium]
MRTITTILLIIFSISFIQAQCISGNCTDGTGIYLFPSGAKYIGQFQDGKINGVGSCYYTDDSKYQGEWVNGYPNGRGIKTSPNGSKKTGQWEKGQAVEEENLSAVQARKDELTEKSAPPEEPQQTGCISGDCQDGKGIYIYPSGAIYIGEFANGEIHGVGVCYYSDGSKYQGQWQHRYPEGRGMKTLADGNKRNGLWEKGQPVDEEGTIIEELAEQSETNEDGINIQTGCISGDCENGEGVFAYPDGSKYEGQFREETINGSGIFQYANGEKHQGAFREGYAHGEGIRFYPDGEQRSGIWEDGEYIGAKKEQAQKEGCIAGNCEDGQGTYVFKNHSAEYVGAFYNYLPHGEGIAYYSNGERYEGTWSEGSFHGKGTLHLMDGTEVTGYWKGGTYLVSQEPTIEESQITLKSPEAESLENIRQNAELKVWAVVIGIAAYNHMPTLNYTDDDAYRMFAFFKSPEGGALKDDQIRILVDEDATKSKITNTMREIYGKAGPNDLILLYFSGHGLKGSFLPIDFDGFNNKLFHDEVNSILDESSAKYKLCIADACHSGSLLAMKSGNVKNTLMKYYETLAQAQAGTALIMSSKSEETSLESSGLRQGVFSHFLIRGLKGEADENNNKVVSVQELYQYISENVRSYTGSRQSPVIKGDYDGSMTVGVVRE